MQPTTNRQRFFQLLSGQTPRPALFFPDLTDWYSAMRTPEGQARMYGAGGMIPDGIPLHNEPGTMPAEFRDWTFLDFYRRFGWGLPLHGYYWYQTIYDGVEMTDVRQGDVRTTTWNCSAGTLVEKHMLAGDGSWGLTEHRVKDLADLRIMRYIVEHTQYKPRYDRLQTLMDQIGQSGACDTVLQRSPFGKLVHMYMGFENVIYNLADSPGEILDFLAFQEHYDLKMAQLAAAAPARVVIMSDHADENLISPRYYEKYCIPFYQKMNAILHNAGKLVSTHLDGNIHGYMPLLKDTGFDILDGCTPAPMMNYEVEELAKATKDKMYCWCGVPATLFCQNLPDKEILDFGRRILDAFDGRVILNVGDILPTNGDIQQVIRLGEMVAQYAK